MRCHGGAPAPPLRIRADRLLSHWLLFGLLGLFPFAAQAAQPIHYAVDLSVPETHLVHVTVTIPDAAAGTEIQMPAWNCLYQIRDFVKDVQDLDGDCDGRHADWVREDLNTWRGPSQTCANLAVHYSVYADADGPFDSMLDARPFVPEPGHGPFLPAPGTRAAGARGVSSSGGLETRHPSGGRRP